MELFLGIILLITYLALIVYGFKGGNLMIGFLVLSVLWTILGIIAGICDWQTLNNTVLDAGPTSFGATAVYIIFGAWFACVLLQTGISGAIIKKATELGGDKPALTCILLCIVTALIFTSSYGAGAVVAIGVIVFPIMLSLGIPKVLAAGSFCMSVGCGLYLNQSLLTQASGVMTDNFGAQRFAEGVTKDWYPYGWACFAIHLVSIIVMVIISNKSGKKSHAWAAQAAPQDKDVPVLAMIAPLIPVLTNMIFGIKMIPGIIIAVIWALLWTKNFTYSKIVSIVSKTFHDGVADVGLVLGFLLFLQMFCKAAGAVKGLLEPIVGPLFSGLPTFALFAVFGVLGFLGLYRGPLTIWGAGMATYMIVASATNLPITVLYPLFYIICCTINTNVCPTQSWNLWAIGYTGVDVKDFMKQTLPYALPCALVLEILGYFMWAA